MSFIRSDSSRTYCYFNMKIMSKYTEYLAHIYMLHLYSLNPGLLWIGYLNWSYAEVHKNSGRFFFDVGEFYFILIFLFKIVNQIS